MKTHLLTFLQDDCLHLVCCAFLRKLSACVGNITAFCQHVLRLIKLGVLANTNIHIGKTQISAWPIYQSISTIYCSYNLIVAGFIKVTWHFWCDCWVDFPPVHQTL